MATEAISFAHLETLATRFSHFGMSGDIEGLGIIELWGLYCFLRRIAGA